MRKLVSDRFFHTFIKINNPSLRSVFVLQAFRFCSIAFATFLNNASEGHSSSSTRSSTASGGDSSDSDQVVGFQFVVKQQQMASHHMTEWTTGLFGCCEDVSSCCYGFWCCPCLACSVAGGFGENRCLPLCDICSPAIVSAFGIPLFTPPAVLALRVGIRHKYAIKGSLCKDIATSCVCLWCSWCQMHRELKVRKKNPAVVNMQPGPAK